MYIRVRTSKKPQSMQHGCYFDTVSKKEKNSFYSRLAPKHQFQAFLRESPSFTIVAKRKRRLFQTPSSIP